MPLFVWVFAFTLLAVACGKLLVDGTCQFIIHDFTLADIEKNFYKRVLHKQQESRVIYHCRHKKYSHCEYVAKELFADDKISNYSSSISAVQEEFDSEVEMMRSLPISPFFPKLFSTKSFLNEASPEEQCCVIFIEYIEGMSLEKLIKSTVRFSFGHLFEEKQGNE